MACHIPTFWNPQMRRAVVATVDHIDRLSAMPRAVALPRLR
ncbi:MAG: formate dehydrogenase subunit delta [Pseudonocardiales bacterium]|nr:formate dehydrogenase subunit delta [Pseudonocardiales bacterium]